MTRPQNTLYWCLWRAAWAIMGKGCDASEETEQRKALHAAHKLPESSTKFTDRHLDKFKMACLAISQDSNLNAQLADGTRDRMLHSVRESLVAHCGDEARAESYAAACLRRAGNYIASNWKLDYANEPQLKALAIVAKRIRKA